MKTLETVNIKEAKNFCIYTCTNQKSIITSNQQQYKQLSQVSIQED